MMLRNVRAKWLLSKLECLDQSRVRLWNPHWGVNHAPQKREKIKQSLISMGSSVLRTVLKASRHEGRFYRNDVLEIMTVVSRDRIGFFIEGLHDQDAEIRWSCTKWLRDLGAESARAIPALIAYIRSGEPSKSVSAPFDAIDALIAIGPESAQAVLELVTDKTAPPKARRAAAVGIYFPQGISVSAEPLVWVLRDSTDTMEIREAIPQAIASIGGSWKSLIPLLNEALDDEDPKTKELAEEALNNLKLANEYKMAGAKA